MGRNKLAPGLTGELSPAASAAVAERVDSGALSPFACKSSSAIRRSSAERDRDTALRPSFVRDAEKIVHLPAYNRMSGKTQVFSFRANDDLSRRGLHVQLVARVARDIGRALGLNLDLIEAIALGHDIGHTPFGHAGERFLNDAYHARTGRWFFHNVQSVRVIDVLGGRNVSLQTLDGCLTHNGEFEQQVFETSGLAEFDTFDRVVASCWETGEGAIGHLRPMTLEGCVVRISDIIAYVGKDRQDAEIAGLLGPQDRFETGPSGAYNAWALQHLTVDIVENSYGKDHIEMSERAFEELAAAKRENYRVIYRSPTVEGECDD
ncbi:deoxyguanosinetriphosphate triphosphohydrolase family protein, partial [Paratractidigestivibacter sp.]|uniref:deoxyguanosinetriphosphate triphosphohydrolase family protein n=1 Tax=Paratractidigestivibacter sp. TaxID=2847316 RepID=UPI003A8E8FA6